MTKHKWKAFRRKYYEKVYTTLNEFYCGRRHFDALFLLNIWYLYRKFLERLCFDIVDIIYFLKQTNGEESWNVTAPAQKPDFVFRRNGRVHLNRRGASVQSTTGSRGVHISVSNAGYIMFRGSVKGIGYPLHLPVSPSLPLPTSLGAITFQLDSTTRPVGNMMAPWSR